MASIHLGKPRISWRWMAALVLFSCGLTGLLAGVGVAERAYVADAGILGKAYYSLGLFVFGGLDLGTPTGGPLWARSLLWLAYFGAPALTASALMDAVLRIVSRDRWWLRTLRGHVVIFGSSDLTSSFLRVLRRYAPDTPAVVVVSALERVRQQELVEVFDVNVIVGDITQDFLLRKLRLESAERVVLLGDDNFAGYEAASKILRQFPHLGGKVILHCHNLRFMRAMQGTHVGLNCVSFNSYHLAATALVRDHLRKHFQKTRSRDTVVIAGFGRFGQTILEELDRLAGDEIETIALIDMDAHRRILVAEEQKSLHGSYRREILEGDISHPEVWRELAASVDLSVGAPVVILGTNRAEDNLRTALWLQQRYPGAMVFARTDRASEFAASVAAEHGIQSIGIAQLVESNIPHAWLSSAPD